MSNTRTRNYCTVVYPESSGDFVEILNDLHIPALVSPIHDKDFNQGTGEVKKPHYHVIIMFDGPKTLKQADDIVQMINGVGCIPINSIRGYARYLCHLDNPEKAQYDTQDVMQLNGADFFGCINLITDKYTAIREMISFCIERNIHSYTDLLIYCSSNNDQWFRILCDSGTIVMKEFLKSRTWDVKAVEFLEANPPAYEQ